MGMLRVCILMIIGFAVTMELAIAATDEKPEAPPVFEAVTADDIPAATEAYRKYKVAIYTGDLAIVRSMIVGIAGARRDVEVDTRQNAVNRRIQVIRRKLRKAPPADEPPADEALASHFNSMKYRVEDKLILATNGTLFIGLRKAQGKWIVDLDQPVEWCRDEAIAATKEQRVSRLEKLADDADAGKVKDSREFESRHTDAFR